MFKKLINKIKLKFMGNVINKLLAPLIQFFKAKTPKMFLAVATIATVLQFGLSAVVNLAIPGIDLPPDFLSLNWIIATTGIPVSDEITSAILWFFALLTGSSSTAWLNPTARTEKVEISKIEAKTVDVDIDANLTKEQKATKIAQLREEKRQKREQIKFERANKR